MSHVLAFKGADRFRVPAYERGAASLRDFEGDLAATAEAGKLDYFGELPRPSRCAPLIKNLPTLRFNW